MQRGVTTGSENRLDMASTNKCTTDFEPETTNLHGKQYKLSVPLYYILVNKSHYKSLFWRLYSIYTYFKGLKGIKTRKM